MTELKDDKPETLYSDFLADRLIEVREKEAHLRFHRRRILSLISSASSFAAISSLLLILFYLIPYSVEVLIGIMASLLGFLIAIITYVFRESDREKQALKYEVYHLDNSKIKLIREWIAFERLSKQLIESRIRPNSPQKLTETIDLIFEADLIGDIDRSILIAALKSRNKIVHIGESGLSQSEESLIQDRLSEINEVLFTELRMTVRESHK